MPAQETTFQLEVTSVSKDPTGRSVRAPHRHSLPSAGL